MQRVFDGPTPRPAGVDEQLFNDDNSVISVNEFGRAVNTAVYRLIPVYDILLAMIDRFRTRAVRPDRAKGHFGDDACGPGWVRFDYGFERNPVWPTIRPVGSNYVSN